MSLGSSRLGPRADSLISVVQARRDQNRIAQREFRMRKQQHIRDLEARVAILSGDRDERQEVMSLLIRNLMNENAQLRKMVKNLAGFIGEGLATCLPRLGLTQESMDAFVNRAETEAAHEAYEALMAVKKKEELKGGASSAASASSGNANNKKGSSYEQLFGPIGGNDTPPESLAGGSKRKASDLVDEDEDDGFEDGDGDDDVGDGEFDHNSSRARASSSSHHDGLHNANPQTSMIMSRSPSINFGTNATTQSTRRGPTSAPSSMRTAPVSTTHGVPLHTLDRLDSPTVGDPGPVDFSFSPYYNHPSSSAGGEGVTPGGLNRAMGNNGGDGIPLQYLASTLHELRDPLASPENAMNAGPLPQYGYQPQQQQQQQRSINLGGPPQQTQYVPAPPTSLTTTNGSSAARPEQGEAARETFDREFDRVISTSMGRKQESFQLISYHLNK